MVITEFKSGRGDHYEITFDEGGRTLLATPELVNEYTLYEGRVLTDEEYWAVSEACALISAKARALRVVGARSISKRDLIRRLVLKGEDEAASMQAAQWLEEKGYLNDADYACTIARHYATKGYGRARIKNELYKRGIDKIHWEFAMSDLPEPDERIDRLLYGKLRGDPDPDRAELKRAVDFLYRRGFSWDDIKSAVERYKETVEASENVL